MGFQDFRQRYPPPSAPLLFDSEELSLAWMSDCSGRPGERGVHIPLGSNFNRDLIPRQGLLALCWGSFGGNGTRGGIWGNQEHHSFISAMMGFQVHHSFPICPTSPVLGLRVPGLSLEGLHVVDFSCPCGFSTGNICYGLCRPQVHVLKFGWNGIKRMETWGQQVA